MSRKINEIGNRYGRLVVIGEAGKTPQGQYRWKCLCDCGNEKVVRGVHLRDERTKSCGCISRERVILPFGQAAFNQLFLHCKHSAKRRDLSFELTKEDFSFLTKMNCHYCGIIPAQIKYKKKGNGVYIYNGLDRVDNNKGYILGNVVPCCGICNSMKRVMTTSEFREHLLRIIKYKGWRTNNV